MSPLTILDNIQIASPCDQDWNSMLGDDRTRFCGSCSKHVYDISAMTAQEATALIVETEGHLCLRIYKRADGTVLTADCPVGLRKVSAGRRLRRLMAAGLILPAMVVAVATARGSSQRTFDPFPTGPGATWNQRIDWALITLGLKTRPVPTMGEMTMGMYAPGSFAPLPPANGAAPGCAEDQETETP